jgi:hypothetical protein
MSTQSTRQKSSVSEAESEALLTISHEGHL